MWEPVGARSRQSGRSLPRTLFRNFTPEQPSSAVQVGNRIQKKALACRAAAGGRSVLLESVQEGGGLRGWSSTTLCPLAVGATSEAWVDGRGGRRNA